MKERETVPSDVSRRSDRDSESSKRGLFANQTVRLLSVVIIVTAVIGLGVFLRQASPEQLLAQARQMESSNPQRALELLGAGVRASHGDFPTAQLLQCQIMTSLRRHEEAFTCFKGIPNAAACPVEDLTKLARAAHAAGQFLLAELAFDAAGDSIRKQAPLLRSWIEVKYELNRRAATLDLCLEYARLAPQDPFPWLVSASILHENQNGPLAVHAYQQALLRNPPEREVSRVRYQLVGLLLELGDLEAARKQCDLLVAAPVNPSSNDLVRLRNADLLRREGKPEDAMAAVNSVLAEHPDSIMAIMIRGFLHFDASNQQLAIDDLSTVVRQEPFNQPAHYKLGQAYLRYRQPDQAALHLERSQELIELSAEILATENRLYNTPRDRTLRLKLVELNEKRGNPEAAARWRQRSPEDVE